MTSSGPSIASTRSARVRRAFQTNRMAAVAGVVFAIPLLAALVILRVAVPDDLGDLGSWAADPATRTAVLSALGLAPLTGVAFLWFIGVVRARIGAREDQLFSTVFFGSGILFVAMLFVSTGMAIGLISALGAHGDASGYDASWRVGRETSYLVLHVYAMKMAAVYTFSTTSVIKRERLVPRWMNLLGVAVGLCLLLLTGVIPWIEILFPLWVLTLSAYFLIVGIGSTPSQGDGGHPRHP